MKRKKSSTADDWTRPLTVIETPCGWRFSVCRAGPPRKFWLVALGVTVVVLLLLTAGLLAKEKKKISRVVTGAVLDERDIGIVGAWVVLTDLQTEKKIGTYTQDGGQYKFSNLLATHDYEVQAVFKDLSSEVRRVTIFDNRNTIVLNLRIPPPREP